MAKLVAIWNRESKTLHHPSGYCGHISYQRASVTAIPIRSWASSEGSHARRVSKLCGECVRSFNFTVPALVAED